MEASVGQNPLGLALLHHVVVDLVQRLVLELEPYAEQPRRRQAHSRLLKYPAGGAACKARAFGH